MEDLHISARATHLQKEPQDLPEMVKVSDKINFKIETVLKDE